MELRFLAGTALFAATAIVACGGATDAARPGEDTPAISMSRLWSPDAGTIRVEGVAPAGTDVTVDGELRHTIVSDGDVLVDLAAPSGAAYSVCLGTDCSRVMVHAGEVHDDEEIARRFEAARAETDRIWDLHCRFPRWRVEFGGVLPGVGGTADPATGSIRIFAHDRTVAEMTVTLLHEFGHAFAAELLDEQRWAAYRQLRATNTSTERSGDPRWHSWDEDFAEHFVWYVTDGAHQPRSGGFVPLVDPDDQPGLVTFFAELDPVCDADIAPAPE